jgi:hypothetical protein
MENKDKPQSLYFGGWATFKDPSSCHVVPHNDLKPHVLDENCWCRPLIDDDGLFDIVVHSAMDDRESYEQGRKTH